MRFFAGIAERIFNINSIYLIVSPTAKLLKIFLVFYVTGAFLFALSFSSLIIISIPLLFFLFYFYYLFSKIWQSYGFSKFYLILLPVIALISGIGLNILIF